MVCAGLLVILATCSGCYFWSILVLCCSFSGFAFAVLFRGMEVGAEAVVCVWSACLVALFSARAVLDAVCGGVWASWACGSFSVVCFLIWPILFDEGKLDG